MSCSLCSRVCTTVLGSREHVGSVVVGNTMSTQRSRDTTGCVPIHLRVEMSGPEDVQLSTESMVCRGYLVV